MQKFATPTAARNSFRAEMGMLKHAEDIRVLGAFGSQKIQPLRKTDTVIFRRLKPFNATATGATGGGEIPDITLADMVTAEGTTPTPHTISYTDVSVTLEQYAVLYKFSSKAELMYEDDIPQDMIKQTGETLGEIAEMVAYGAVKAGSSVIYAGSSMTTRAGGNATITLGNLRAAARSMGSNRAKPITSSIKPGANFGTQAVEPAYLVFMHTDMVSDIRDIPDFTKRVNYGSAIKPAHEREIGSVEEFRFIPSPVFKPYLAGGAAVGSTGLVSRNATNIDVYPVVVLAEDALGHVSLKGHGYTSITPTLLKSDDINHANPSGMFGFAGGNFWYAAVRLNENWMTRIEAGATDL